MRWLLYCPQCKRLIMVFQALCLASAVSFNPIAFRGEWWVVHSGPGHSMPKKELALIQARFFRAPGGSRLIGQG